MIFPQAKKEDPLRYLQLFWARDRKHFIYAPYRKVFLLSLAFLLDKMEATFIMATFNLLMTFCACLGVSSLSFIKLSYFSLSIFYLIFICVNCHFLDLLTYNPFIDMNYFVISKIWTIFTLIGRPFLRRYFQAPWYFLTLILVIFLIDLILGFKSPRLTAMRIFSFIMSMSWVLGQSAFN